MQLLATSYFLIPFRIHFPVKNSPLFPGIMVHLPGNTTDESQHLHHGQGGITLNNGKTTGYIVAGIGLIASLIGYSLLPDQWGSGILGFGLAHVLLGLLDSVRPGVREKG